MTTGTGVVELHALAVERFRSLVQSVPAESWSGPTPCADWDVRALVNHVAGEELWTVPLLAGRTIAEVGDSFDGDVLRAEPTLAVDSAAKAAVAAFEEPGAPDRTVHLSFGDTPASEYAMQLIADHVIHGWDLAAAIGSDTQIDEGLVAVLTGWYADRAELYRGAGLVAQPPAVAAGSPQDQLLVAFGRDPSWSASDQG